MNFTNKLTFFKAVLLPLKIAPFENGVQILVMFIGLITAPLNVLVVAYFINTAIDIVANSSEWSRIFAPLLVMTILSTYDYVQGPLLSLVNTRCQNKMTLSLRDSFIKKQVKLEYKHIEDSKTLDLIKRIWQNPEWDVTNFLTNLIGLITAVGTSLSYAVILVANAPITGVILIATSIPVFIIAKIAGKDIYNAWRDASKDARTHWAISGYIGNRDYVSERKLFGFTDNLSKRGYKHFELERTRKLKSSAKWFFRTNVTSFMLGAFSAIGLFIMAPAVATGALSIGMFISLQGALFAVIGWLGWTIPNRFQTFSHQKEFIKDLNVFFELSEVPNSECLPTTPPLEFKSLEFKSVSFTYPGTDKLILNNLSLKIEAGKHYSFVGVNGAGKTTLTKLITRLYDNYEGEILLNGKSLRDWDIADIKSCFCTLFQNFARYDITVAENILLGKITGATEDEVNNAVLLSGFEAKADELKDGIHTLLGKTHDDGIDLSGGQWQRIAFARAIISQAPVKILDEPTAALDPIAESNVYAQFEEISRGFTTIFISHRLASAKLADVIFVIENGKVVEQGSHKNLMEQKGLYAEMFESQQSWYE